MSNFVEEENNPYFITYTGKFFHFLKPQPEEISIIDIAHALSGICRFNSHLPCFYSVAQHSISVSDLSPNYRLTGLLHDASEAYLCDQVSFLKPFINNYENIELNVMNVIAQRFGFDWPIPEEVHIADKIMVFAEIRDLSPSISAHKIRIGKYMKKTIGDKKLPETKIEPISRLRSEYKFLERFLELYKGPYERIDCRHRIMSIIEEFKEYEW